MTHSIAYSTGLSVNAVDWTRTDGRIFTRITEGLYDGLEVRGRDTLVPSLPGQIPRSRIGDSRLIKGEGMVMGVGADEEAQRADFQATRSDMFEQMRGTNDPYALVVTQEDGTTATILARPLRIEWGDDRIPTYREFIAYWLAVGDPSEAVSPASPDWLFEGGGS